MTKAQKEDLKYKQDASIKMVNKYVDGSGAVRVSRPYIYIYICVCVCLVMLDLLQNIGHMYFLQ